ncbi:MAG: DUF2190 domain-containing protein [Balneolales bacterium]
MKTEGLIKTFIADGAVTGRRLVKPGAADGQATQASAVTDAIIGVSDAVGADASGRLDVIMSDIAEVEFGGAITRGDFITSDADGKAVAAAPAAGVNNSVAGRAMISGVDGDFGYVLLAPGQIQGA